MLLTVSDEIFAQAHKLLLRCMAITCECPAHQEPSFLLGYAPYTSFSPLLFHIFVGPIYGGLDIRKNSFGLLYSITTRSTRFNPSVKTDFTCIRSAGSLS